MCSQGYDTISAQLSSPEAVRFDLDPRESDNRHRRARRFEIRVGLKRSDRVPQLIALSVVVKAQETQEAQPTELSALILDELLRLRKVKSHSRFAPPRTGRGAAQDGT